MIGILFNGCNGKMGQTMSNILKDNQELKIVGGVSPSGITRNDYPVFKSIFDCNIDFDIIIDFSNPSALDDLLEYSKKNNKPLIIATTGHSKEQKEKININSKHIPILFCANTSLGINLLIDMVKRVLPILKDNFDIEIVEKHHNQKVDAPSGTALAIANSINDSIDNLYSFEFDRHSSKEKRKKNEIGIHSVRGGTIVGEHSVIFAGNDEVLEIKHIAYSKKVFAEGAIKAAKFLLNKPAGLFTMNDVIKE